MKLIKIGNQIINVDTIDRVWYSEPTEPGHKYFCGIRFNGSNCEIGHDTEFWDEQPIQAWNALCRCVEEEP